MNTAQSAPPRTSSSAPRAGGDLFELPATEPRAAPEDEPPPPPQRSWREELRDVDWEVVRSLWARETLITIRSRAWVRLLTWFAVGTTLLAVLPLLYRMAPDHWSWPGNFRWVQIWSAGTALMLLASVSGWTRRRITRELRGGSLEEILLTGSGPADILLGKALAAACLTSLLVLAAMPALILATAVGGRHPHAMARLAITLGCSAYLGLCLGMEYSFRKPGSQSTVGTLWGWFYWALLLGNLGRWFLNWDWLAVPRRFAIRYNPLSTLMAAAGGRHERWPLGITLFFLLLGLLTLVSFRLLRREWAEAASHERQASWLQRLLAPPRRADADAPPEPLGEYPVEEFEDRFGHRLRIPSWLWIIGGGVAFLLLLVPRAEIGRVLFAAFFWGAAWTAAHSACAAFSRERELGRWEELALLPLSDREITTGKLRAGVHTWLGLAGCGAVCLLASVLWTRSPNWALTAWGLPALLVTPWTMARFGALLGLVTLNAEEAHWRVSILSTVLPALLIAGSLSGFQLGTASAVVPTFAAMDAVRTGAVPLSAWLGTALYPLIGATGGHLLTTRLRLWALAHA